MNSLHLFAGIGGGILADKILGHRIVGAVEIEPYCRAVLKQRQEEGLLEPFPLFDDIRTFNGDEITERIDLICGGFPCQDISTAGKGKGVVKGEKSSLFFELVRVCGAIRPAYIFLENSPAITGRGLGACLNEIARIGYDAEWFTLSAGDCGAPHLRKRWWAVCKRQDSDADRERELQPERLVEDLRRRFSYLGQEVVRDSYRGSCEDWTETEWSGGDCQTSCGGNLRNANDVRRNETLYVGNACISNEEGTSGPAGANNRYGNGGGIEGAREDTDSPRERCEAAMWERLFRYAPGLYCQQSERTQEGIGDDSLSRGTRDSADAEGQRRLWETERVGREPSGTVPLVSRSTFSDAGGGGDSPPDGGRETADAASMGRDKGSDAEEHRRGNQEGFSAACDSGIGYFPGWWEIEPPLGRVANGIPNRVDRLKGLGNAQVPVCAALAFYLLLRRYCEK